MLIRFLLIFLKIFQTWFLPRFAIRIADPENGIVGHMPIILSDKLTLVALLWFILIWFKGQTTFETVRFKTLMNQTTLNDSRFRVEVLSKILLSSS